MKAIQELWHGFTVMLLIGYPFVFGILVWLTMEYAREGAMPVEMLLVRGIVLYIGIIVLWQSGSVRKNKNYIFVCKVLDMLRGRA